MYSFIVYNYGIEILNTSVLLGLHSCGNELDVILPFLLLQGYIVSSWIVTCTQLGAPLISLCWVLYLGSIDVVIGGHKWMYLLIDMMQREFYYYYMISGMVAFYIVPSN